MRSASEGDKHTLVMLGAKRFLGVKISKSCSRNELEVSYHMLEAYKLLADASVISFLEEVQDFIGDLIENAMGESNGYKVLVPFIWITSSRVKLVQEFKDLINMHQSKNISRDNFINQLLSCSLNISQFGRFHVNFPEFQSVVYYLLFSIFEDNLFDGRIMIIYRIFCGNDIPYDINSCKSFTVSSKFMDIFNLSSVFKLPLHKLKGECVEKIAGLSSFLKQESYIPSRPLSYIQRLFGYITLDVASSSVAQETVKASCYFSKQVQGLNFEWFGNVWVNPPYTTEQGIGILDFVKKSIHEVEKVQRLKPLQNIFIFLPKSTDFCLIGMTEYQQLLMNQSEKGNMLVYEFNLNFKSLSSGCLEPTLFNSQNPYETYHLFHLFTDKSDKSIHSSLLRISSSNLLVLETSIWNTNFKFASAPNISGSLNASFTAMFTKKFKNKRKNSKLHYQILSEFPYAPQAKSIEIQLRSSNRTTLNLITEIMLLLDLTVDWNREPNIQNRRVTKDVFQIIFLCIFSKLYTTDGAPIVQYTSPNVESTYFRGNWKYIFGT